MKELLKRLICLEIMEEGISPKTHSTLPENEKKLLLEKGGRHFVKPEERKKVKVVATGGVFNIIHLGHVHTLRKAKVQGDMLVVVVATDEHAGKSKRLVHDQEERRELVESVRWVDLAIVGKQDKLETFRRIAPDVIVFGYDQKPEFQGLAKIVKLELGYKPEMLKSSKLLNGNGGNGK